MWIGDQEKWRPEELAEDQGRDQAAARVVPPPLNCPLHLRHALPVQNTAGDTQTEPSRGATTWPCPARATSRYIRPDDRERLALLPGSAANVSPVHRSPSLPRHDPSRQ